MKNQTRRSFIKNASVMGAALTATPALQLSAESSQMEGPGSVSSSLEGDGRRRVSPDEYMPAAATALIVVDSYNDFLSSDGKTWPLLNLVVDELGVVGNIKSTLESCRKAGIVVAFAPHHRYRSESDFSDRKYLHPSQVGQLESKVFSDGEFGGQFYQGLGPIDGDVVSSEHTCSSGFAETDLDLQLQEKNISHLILVGCISNTCVEATARSAVDLGYYVTVVTDAIAAFSPSDHRTAVDVNYPLVINNTVLTTELLSDMKPAKAVS